MAADEMRAGRVRSLLRDLRPSTGPTITIGISHPADDMEDDEDIDLATGKPRTKKPGDDTEPADMDELFPGSPAVPDAPASDKKPKKGMKK